MTTKRSRNEKDKKDLKARLLGFIEELRTEKPPLKKEEKELVEGRTLEEKGAKHVQVNVQRIGTTTHSLTVQPEISAAGDLMSPLLVVFREPKVPKNFEKEMEEFDNLRCRSTPSGKMTTALEREYVEEVILPRVEEGIQIIIDSWTGFKNAINGEEVEEKEVRFHTIPKGATGRIQPLDVFFNRQFKDLLRTLCRLIRRRHPDYIISQCKNLVRLLSLVHFQFTAERFRAMIQYAWYASGFYEDRPPAFRTPAQFCVTDNAAATKCTHCEDEDMDME